MIIVLLSSLDSRDFMFNKYDTLCREMYGGVYKLVHYKQFNNTDTVPSMIIVATNLGARRSVCEMLCARFYNVLTEPLLVNDYHRLKHMDRLTIIDDRVMDPSIRAAVPLQISPPRDTTITLVSRYKDNSMYEQLIKELFCVSSIIHFQKLSSVQILQTIPKQNKKITRVNDCRKVLLYMTTEQGVSLFVHVEEDGQVCDHRIEILNLEHDMIVDRNDNYGEIGYLNRFACANLAFFMTPQKTPHQQVAYSIMSFVETTLLRQ